VPVKRALAAALLITAIVPGRAWAKGDKKASDDDEAEETSSDDNDDGDGDEDEADDSSKATPAAKSDESDDDDDGDEDEGTDEDGLRQKQNLSGRDEGTDKKPSSFEKDRFFVDKVDTEATEKGTLIQGSLSSSSFLYS
jgi:hypothetical protein